MNPQKIKEIRQSLGLSQAEAGELLGGGSSAFAKYEKGSVKPSAALVRILRLLEKKPERLPEITGQEVEEKKPATTPFDVTDEDVSRLKPSEFSTLVEKLLVAEALQCNLPLDGIHVAFETAAPDGGEDARIEWRDGPPRTHFLPRRFCQFQLKTGYVSPKKAGDEVLTAENKLRPMVREALERGASYIMLCSSPYTQNLIDRRLDEIRKNLGNHGFKDPSVQFRDSGQIASWVNYHPSVAIWLLRKTRPGLIDSFFEDWKHWSGRPEHCDSPWIDDPRLPGFRERLRAIVETPKGVARVVGLSGAGKSRLALEAFGPTKTERISGAKLSDLVLYAVESEAGSQKIKEYATNLANSGKRVVLVVDRCSEETRIDLVSIVKHSVSSLSLVTISWEIPPNAEESENTLVVGAAENSLVENIIKSLDPGIIETDRRRIIVFSEGDITCARIIAGSWMEKGLTASENEDFLVRKLLGGDSQEYVYEAAMIVSAFGGVATEAVYDEKTELEEIAEFSNTISVEDFRGAVRKLKRRGVVRQQGGLAILKPECAALILARWQWEEWGNKQREEVLVGTLSERLRERVAKQLASLNMESIATRVVRHMLGNRMFSRSPGVWKSNLRILVWLAEIDPRGTVDVLKDILGPLKRVQIREITGTARRDLTATLSKIAFAENTFEDAAVLLLELACGESENIINNARDRFKSLFPVYLANTAAGSGKRLDLIGELVDDYWDHSDSYLPVLVDALLEGAKTGDRFRRYTGPEIHGSRPSLEPWLPETESEFWDYVKGCVSHLVKLARRSDDIGKRARVELGLKWRKYVSDGLIEDVERWTREIKEKHPCWPEALDSLEKFLEYSLDNIDPLVERRVEALIRTLEPEDLDDRIRFLITEMPFNYLKRKNIDHDKMFELQCKKLRELAGELLVRETELTKLIPELCVGRHRNARLFGYFMAEQAEAPLYWKKKITEAFESASEEERDGDFLVGYMTGLKEREPKEVERFKRESVRSSVFASVFPRLPLYVGISPDDVELLIEALEAGFISHREMFAWNPSVLSKLRPDEVIPLFDLLLKKENSSSFGLALDFIYSYAYKREECLEYFRPQLLLVARYPMINTEEVYDKSSHEHCYETLMNWIISKGSTDTDARKVAITIAKQLATEDLTYNDQKMIAHVLPGLLSNFAEIVWPLISGVLTEEDDLSSESEMRSWRLSKMLRGELSSGDGTKPILSLPQNMLFGWCYSSPETGPAFVAETFPLLKERDRETASEEFHPVIKRLLDEFGKREEVLDVLAANMRTFSGWGSEAEHLARYMEPLRSIENHEKGTVRRWAGKMLRRIDDEIETLKV